MSSKSYKELTQDLGKAVGTLRSAQSGTLDAFTAMSKAAMEPGVLSAIDKELMALSIGVAGHCDGCIGFHVKTLVRLGASYAQLTETLAVAVYMGGGPSLMYAADSVRAWEEFGGET
ncbi:MAG: carboxymuconolactone decarboxylase family protein [Rhodanobacter sp.]